jgi:hypothetical protein
VRWLERHGLTAEGFKSRHGELVSVFRDPWPAPRYVIPHYAQWLVIARCETGSNWQHNSGTYQGGLGFYRGSWDAFNTFGFPAEAYLATPEQQMVVAEAIWRAYGFSGWGCAVYL